MYTLFFYQAPLFRHSKGAWLKFSKILPLVILYNTVGSELTFENWKLPLPTAAKGTGKKIPMGWLRLVGSLKW